MGRNYLMLPGGGAVHSLATVLKRAAEEPPHGAATAGGAAGAGDSCGGSRDGPAVVQSLAALQKLSLRRAAQSQMIGQGLVAWLVSYMQVGIAVRAVLARTCGLGFCIDENCYERREEWALYSVVHASD